MESIIIAVCNLFLCWLGSQGDKD